MPMQRREASEPQAEFIALFRALESARPAAHRLFDDRFAGRSFGLGFASSSVSPDFLSWSVAFPALVDHRWPGARTSGVARTRFIDEVVAATSGLGRSQSRHTGAGFDARAYRIAAMAKAAVFEVDQPATAAAKQEAGGGCPWGGAEARAFCHHRLQHRSRYRTL